MAVQGNQNKEGFFDLIEQDQKIIDDPFASDEVIFRDASGKLKVLKEGQVEEVKDSAEPAESINAGIVEKELAQAKKAFELPEEEKVTIEAPKIDIDKEVKHVIEESGIKFNDVDIEKRFKNIVRSGLKKVRNSVQTKEAFLKPMTEGGMGFDPQTSDKMLSIIRKHVDHLEKKIVEEKKDSLSELQSEMDDLLKSKKEEIKKEVEEVEKDLPTPDFAPVAEPNKSIIDKVKEEDEVKAQEKKEQEQTIPPEPVREKKIEQAPVMARPIVSNVPNKPKIQDVKFQPKLTGPVEEIRSMTIIDFRRLSPDPRQAIEKIIEKINLLEEESFTQKTQAIKAWKESEVNRMYIDLGDASMEQGKSIAEIIEATKAAGGEILTNDEVEAIIELNQRLRY